MILLLLAAWASAAPVQIQVQNLRSDVGSIEISLFADPAAWDRQVASQILRIRPLAGPTASLEADLPPGEYAFFLYHDVNDNGQLERSFLGMPKEPYALSNGVVLRLSKPRWDELKFVVGEDGAVQTVDLSYP